MKKNVKLLIAVIAVIALLIGGIVAVMRMEESGGEEDQPTKTPVPQYDAYKIARDDIDTLVINLENESIKLKNTQNGTWSVNGTPYDEIDSSKLETLLGSVCTMMSNNEIEKGAADLSKYGLDKPYITIDVTRKADGKTDKLLIGDLSPTLGEYFFTVDGSGDVYTIYSYKVDNIIKPSSYYKTYNRFSVKADDITNIKMERSGKDTLELRVKNITEDDGYSIVWEVVQPYKKVFNGIDQFINDKILTPISEISIGAPAEEGADCGFDKPSAVLTITVEPYDEQSGKHGDKVIEKIIIGNTAEGLTYVSYKDKAYAVSKGTFDFVNTDAFLTVSKLQALVDIQSTDKVTVTAPNVKAVMDIKHGDTASDMTFKINGNDAGDKVSRQMYQSIISMNVDAMYEGEPLGDTEVSVVYDGYKGNPKVTVEFKPINALNYALVRDGEVYFVIKKTKVDEMLLKLNDYISNPMGE